MPATTRPLFEAIDSWMESIDNTKEASAKTKSKKAGLAKKAVGETTHPSEKVDDHTQEAETGDRFSENKTDVERDVPGTSVDETDENSGGDQDERQLHIGLNPRATGEDASTETESVKGDKDDPGTDHPANADDVGEKYSSLRLPKLLKLAEGRANEILADLANGLFDKPGQPSYRPVATKTVSPANLQKTAAQGYQAAQRADVAEADLEKQAVDFIAQAIRDAELDADLVGAYWHNYMNTKAAADEMTPPPEDGPPVDPAMMGGGGGMPPGAMGGGGGPPGADALAALGAGGGPPGGEGGPPVDAGMAGGGEMPPGAEETAGAPPGAEAGPGGGGDREKALQELRMALMELGLTEDDLKDLGGAEGAKLAAASKEYARSGKFRFAEAKTASQKQAREQIKAYIKELIGNK